MGSGALLVCLLVVVRPEASQGLGAFQRTFFWALHVGTGIAAMFAASMLIRQSLLVQLGVLPSIILCGLLGTLLVSPLYLLIDQLWPATGTQEIDDWLDTLHHAGAVGSVLAEFLEVLPWTMTAWLMINLPLLNMTLLNQPILEHVTGTDDEELSLENQVQPLAPTRVSEQRRHRKADEQLTLVSTGNTTSANSSSPGSANTAAKSPDALATDPVRSGSVDADAAGHSSGTNAVAMQSAQQQPLADADPSAIDETEITNRFLQTLPGIFGKDIIAITSDLHYLNVFTLVGKTTVLGNLRDVVAELQDTGLQVHRSHWVAHKHVDRIVNSGGQPACIMSNGIRVPISRRRWKAVREYYGQGVINRS